LVKTCTIKKTLAHSTRVLLCSQKPREEKEVPGREEPSENGRAVASTKVRGNEVDIKRAIHPKTLNGNSVIFLLKNKQGFLEPIPFNKTRLGCMETTDKTSV